MAYRWADPLATMLYLPRPQPGFVSRPRLVERLQEGLARGPLPAGGLVWFDALERATFGSLRPTRRRWWTDRSLKPGKSSTAGFEGLEVARREIAEARARPT